MSTFTDLLLDRCWQAEAKANDVGSKPQMINFACHQSGGKKSKSKSAAEGPAASLRVCWFVETISFSAFCWAAIVDVFHQAPGDFMDFWGFFYS